MTVSAQMRFKEHVLKMAATETETKKKTKTVAVGRIRTYARRAELISSQSP